MNWELAANMATVITSISIFFAMLQLVKEMRKESWEAFFTYTNIFHKINLVKQGKK